MAEMKKGRPDKATKSVRKSNNLDADLDTMQSYKDDFVVIGEDETKEAGEGTEMVFYSDEDY
jgi:hypothetical protein